MNKQLIKIAEDWVKSFNAQRTYHQRFADLSDIMPPGMEALGKIIKEARKIKEVHQYLLNAKEAYTNNEDLKVNININKALAVIEDWDDYNETIL